MPHIEADRLGARASRPLRNLTCPILSHRNAGCRDHTSLCSETRLRGIGRL